MLKDIAAFPEKVHQAMEKLEPSIISRHLIDLAQSFNRFYHEHPIVVEDEAAISLLLEDMLLDFGCEVIGPAARVAAALELARDAMIDIAILDVNLAGESSYPVAQALDALGVPFLFSTGYGSDGIKDGFRERPVLEKPFAQHDLRQKLIAARRAQPPSSRGLNASSGV